MTTFLFKHLLAFSILFLSINLFSQTSGKVLPAEDENPIWFNNGKVGIGVSSPNTTFQVNGITTLGNGNVINPANTSLLRFPATGTAGQQRVYIELQGVHNNDVANENGGGFIKFRTSTAAGYGPEIGGIRRGGGTGDFLIKTGGMNATERLRVLDNGNVGIGTSSPTEKLDVNGTIKGRNISLEPTSGGISLKPSNNQWDSYFVIKDPENTDRNFGISTGGGGINSTSWFPSISGKVNTNHPAINFTGVQADSTNNYPILVLDARKNGKIALNQPLVAISNGYGNFKVKFLADGTITSVGGAQFEKDVQVNATLTANEIRVVANGQTADFVFENDYNLRSLEEVESFILENKHLPEIPSATQMEAEGTNIAEMNKLLLMKIEELTLYMIEQQKIINELKEAVSKQ